MMGASLCKSIKKNKISNKITGFDANPKSLDYALKNKIVDNAVSKISDIDHPDLIILCTPISSYEELTLKLSMTVTKKCQKKNLKPFGDIRRCKGVASSFKRVQNLVYSLKSF